MKKLRQAVLNNWATVSILVAVSACGGGSGGDGQPKASTLAYVVTECRGDAQGGTIRQRLQIRQGDQVPITVVEHTSAIGVVAFAGCRDVGLNRQGPAFAQFGVFHRLGVTPDGSQVVFEVTDEVTDDGLLFPLNTLPAEQKGIFVAYADGTGQPRRLGPASRVGSFFTSFFVFSPNGRTIAYTDRGPSPDNQDAVQIFTLDLATAGDRRQVTQLPPAAPSAPFGGTYNPFFNDNDTITFFSYANADGNHPDAANIVVTVKTDGTNLKVAPSVVAIPGSEVLTSFRITGSEVNAAVLIVPGMPVNPDLNGNGGVIQDVFDVDQNNNVLQLTNFRRTDTLTPTVSADGQRVFFSASADPLGTNLTENCQMFSIDRTGGDLRQLTDFHEASSHAANGCSFGRKPFGCGSFFAGRDIQSGAVLFYSSCDPFGTNPHGSQLFSLHEDGTGLRQLTNTQGYTRDASGAVIVELPFPFAYPGFLLRNQL